MYNIIDYFYSPILWIIVNAGILMSIIIVIRTTNKVKKLQRITTLDRHLNELIEAINKKISESPRENASYYANLVIKFSASIGLGEINQGQTFREFVESLKSYSFVDQSDLNNLIRLYEYARFGGTSLDEGFIEELKSIILKVCRAAKTYVETQYPIDEPKPS
jgi:hypothetical protein